MSLGHALSPHRRGRTRCLLIHPNAMAVRKSDTRPRSPVPNARLTHLCSCTENLEDPEPLGGPKLRASSTRLHSLRSAIGPHRNRPTDIRWPERLVACLAEADTYPRPVTLHDARKRIFVPTETRDFRKDGCLAPIRLETATPGEIAAVITNFCEVILMKGLFMSYSRCL